MTTKNTKTLEAALERLVKRHREYYEGWLKAWLEAASAPRKEDKAPRD